MKRGTYLTNVMMTSPSQYGDTSVFADVITLSFLKDIHACQMHHAGTQLLAEACRLWYDDHDHH